MGKISFDGVLARWRQYAYLMRFNKPIGIGLLLWPTLWALWLAAGGLPSYKLLFIFILGVILMRSAGCVMNDLADRSFDVHVARTRLRPLASGTVTPVEAIILMLVLSLTAFILVLQCNRLTVVLAVMGAVFTVLYPFLKRITHLPQLGLGIAFSWGVPMAFAAQTGSVNASAWTVFLTCLIWPIIYDTQYAMVDKDDDVKIGVKSTAILFNSSAPFWIGMLQLLFIAMLLFMGSLFHLHLFYQLSVMAAALLFIYQQWLIKDQQRDACFQAFLNHHWVGCIIFLGIVLGGL